MKLLANKIFKIARNMLRISAILMTIQQVDIVSEFRMDENKRKNRYPSFFDIYLTV